MEKSKYKNYLIDLGMIIKENALGVKKENGEKGDDYINGKLMAYYEIVSLLKQQADAFDIDLKDISLQDFDEDKELLF